MVGSPPMIHSAISLPTPPAPPYPLSEKPAAIHMLFTPAIGPRTGWQSGRVRTGVADQRDDARLVEERQAADGPFQQLLEAVHVGWQGIAAMLPRDTVDPAFERIRFISTDHQSALLLAHVNEIIGIAQAGSLCVELVTGNGFERDMLVINRCGREIQARHRGDTRRPQARRVDDQLGLDGSFVCHHFRDLRLWLTV